METNPELKKTLALKHCTGKKFDVNNEWGMFFLCLFHLGLQHTVKLSDVKKRSRRLPLKSKSEHKIYQITIKLYKRNSFVSVCVLFVSAGNDAQGLNGSDSVNTWCNMTFFAKWERAKRGGVERRVTHKTLQSLETKHHKSFSKPIPLRFCA